MAGGERGHADDMDSPLRRLRCDLLGRGEERADLDLETEIGESRGDDLLAAVMAVLPHLRDQDARRPAVVLGKGARHRDDAAIGVALRASFGEIDAGDRRRFGDVAAERLLHRQRDLADRRLRARGCDREAQQIGVAARALRSARPARPASPFRLVRRAGA